MKIDYDYRSISYQKKFHESTKPKALLSTGFGGGKTYSLDMKCFQLMDLNRGLPGGMLCPSIKMYKRDVLPLFREICAENKIRYKYNKTDLVWFFPNAQATMYIHHSEDDGASIKGPNYAWGAVNEIASCTEMAVKMLMGRIRHKKAKRLQFIASGTPEGFNWTYDYFIEKPRPDTDLIIGDARENKYVHETYFDQLTEDYDGPEAEMYIGGKWVNLSGKGCVHAFDRMKHTADGVNYLEAEDIWVPLDFNVAPMCGSLWQLRQTGYDHRTSKYTTRRLQCFDQIQIMDSNTWEFCKVLDEKLTALGVRKDGAGNWPGITIYPDPAGVGRSTKSHYTDFDILREHGYRVLKYKTKLSVRDCINAVNRTFKNDGAIINKKCSDVIADLEQCIFKKGIFEIDKSNPKRSHHLDGIKNMMDYEFPVRRKRPMRVEKVL